MPIVYVHGVANRKNDPSYKLHVQEIERLLSQYVAPVIPTTTVKTAYWGDYGAQFAWDGASRPRTVLRGQGTAGGSYSDTDHALALASVRLEQALGSTAASQGSPLLVPAGPKSSASGLGESRLRDFSSNELSDILATMIVTDVRDLTVRPALLIAVDEVAADPNTSAELSKCESLEDELEVLRTRLARTVTPALVGQGAGGTWSGIVDHLGETMSRLSNTPAFLLSTLVAEWRPKINELVTLFLGDVFTYLANRGSSIPGDIPKAVIDTMNQANRSVPGEPLVVVTHSMGGQIVYDLVTHFLPSLNSNLRVDFWCATASQVGLFEEMKLFEVHSPDYSKKTGKKSPLPDRHYLGCWWNVWDHNDFLSYTGSPIFEGIDDEPYNSGVSLVEAHGEYLLRPSFHRKLASKVVEAKKLKWRCL
jgi:hypothetical protein